MPERKPYQGPARKLVLAFDVGTTYSAVSYSILCPGEPPVIFGVNCFPTTDNVGSNSKVPSVVYYDLEGVPRAFGGDSGEATLESMIERVVEEWVRVEWWKLHLGPVNMPYVSDQDIPPLPPNRTATQVLADFMHYLFECARTYIQETHASGRDMWTSFEDNIDFVLSHPNGWDGPQQTQIRRAAVLAGFVPDCPEGQSRIHLVVTEGEASLHYCLSTENTAGPFEEDQGIMVIDASSVTVDINSYYTTSPVTFQEIAPPECLLQGAISVTTRAKKFLAEKLAGSKYGTEEDICQMTSKFYKTTMLRFSNPAETSYIRFGTVRDRDLAFNIKSGQLEIPGADIATLFEPSVAAIIAAVENQRRRATKPINSVFLIGAFAASDWLFVRLQDHIKPLNLKFCRPGSHTNEAVADGAIAFYLNHRVSACVAKFTYGTRCAVEFNKNNEQHKLRAASAVPHPSGRMVLPNAFSAILYKGTTVSEAKEFRKDFITECTERTSCDTIAMEIVCYRGNSSSPRWTDSEPEMFSNLCTIHADTSQVFKTLSPRRGFPGLQFYRRQYSIVLMFGMTELQAQISWIENGEEKRGPATIVYD